MGIRSRDLELHTFAPRDYHDLLAHALQLHVSALPDSGQPLGQEPLLLHCHGTSPHVEAGCEKERVEKRLGLSSEHLSCWQ